MKNWKKLALIVGGVLVLLAIVGFTVEQSRKGVVTVQTGKVVREDLVSVVTASGEIKPKVHVNIGSNAFAKVTHLYVKEGDRVKKGQMLAMLDNVQSAADVSANDSALNAARTDAVAAQAAVNTAAADLNQCRGRVRTRQARLRSKQVVVRRPTDRQVRLRHQEGGLWTRRRRRWDRPRPSWSKPRPNWIPPRAISSRTPPIFATPPMC